MPIVTGPGKAAFVQLEITAVFEMIGSAILTFPADRLLIAIYSADADFDDLQLHALSNDGTEPYTDDLVATWVPVRDRWSRFPPGIVTDGVLWRLLNSGANAVSGIQYFYMPV